MLLNQDKGQGIVILDRTKYIKKYMNLINKDQFRELENKTNRNKITKLTQEFKNNKSLSEEDYKRIYPKSSRPGSFYGTEKVHKLKENLHCRELTFKTDHIKCRNSNIKTAKHLATLLLPSTSSEYNIKKQLRIC